MGRNMKNIKLTIEYDGKEYQGWQKQPTKLNIQGEIENAIEHITGEKVDLIGSGRTDRGVHAVAQVANFKMISNFPVEKMPVAINSQLKKSIRIIKAEEVSIEFHSRYNCKEKTYCYVIDNSKEGSAIFRNFSYHESQSLNISLMKKAIKHLEGEHDFSSFRSSGGGNKNSIRTIFNAEIIVKGNYIIIKLTGNGFLYNMVRIIAGTMLEVGLGKIKESEIIDIMESKNRQNAGKTLPPYGLFLCNVEYVTK